MDELAAMRKQRAALLRAQIQQQQENAEVSQQIAEAETVIKRYFTPEALQRFGNIKAAHPERATRIIAIIAQAIQNGQLKSAISDDQFKGLLEQLKTREIKIKR